LFAKTGGVFSTGGPFSLSVAVPNCFFQVDLMATATPPGSLTTPADIHAQVVVEGVFGGTSAACTTSGGGGGGGTSGTPPSSPPSGGTLTPPSTPTTTTTAVTTTTTTSAPTTTTPSGPFTPPSAPRATTAGKTATQGAGFAAAARTATLPFTGLPLWIVVVAGSGLLLIGLPLMRVFRRST
jgi:hypothetical protein